jgi:gas vesicle protein
MGYFRGVVHGTVVGTVIGLCIAPQEGSRTRAQLQRAADQARSGVQRAQETARTMMPVAQSAARSVAVAASSVRGGVDRIRSHDEEQAEPYVSVNGSGNGNPTVHH